MDDLFRPVPAAGAPAFWTKKTSSVGGYLFLYVSFPSTHRRYLMWFVSAYHVTASWNSGSDSEDASKVKDGSLPMMS